MAKPTRILAAQKFLSTAENNSRFLRDVFSTAVDITGPHLNSDSLQGSGTVDMENQLTNSDWIPKSLAFARSAAIASSTCAAFIASMTWLRRSRARSGCVAGENRVGL